VRVAIRLVPRARADELAAIVAIPEGGRVLKATVTAPPEDGRANEALLRLLARAWHIPRQDISIIHGLTSRNKVIQVAGDPHRLFEQITPEIAGLPGW
jgi:uncharacterized protein